MDPETKLIFAFNFQSEEILLTSIIFVGSSTAGGWSSVQLWRKEGKTLSFETLILQSGKLYIWDVMKRRFDISSPQTILMSSDPQWVVALSGRWFSLRSLGTKRVWQDHVALLCSRQVITTQKKP